MNKCDKDNRKDPFYVCGHWDMSEKKLRCVFLCVLTNTFNLFLFNYVKLFMCLVIYAIDKCEVCYVIWKIENNTTEWEMHKTAHLFDSSIAKLHLISVKLT